MSWSRYLEQARTGGIAWTLFRRVGMVLVLALSFFLSATITIFILFRGGDTRVPDLVGKSGMEARRMAEAAGFNVRVQPFSDPAVVAPADTVIKTVPGPNSTAKKNSVLTIYVAVGPPQASNGIIRRCLDPGSFDVGRARAQLLTRVAGG